MAIKIIAPGADVYTATCTECGCRFTYERDDVFTNYRTGGECVSCPQCGHNHLHFGVTGRPRGCGRRDGYGTQSGGYRSWGPQPCGHK